METKQLTQKIIYDCIVGTDNGKQNSMIAKTVSIIFFVLGGICLLLPVIFFCGIFFLGIALLITFMRRKSDSIIQSVLQKRYTLQQDVCISKDLSVSPDLDQPNMPYLVFNISGRCDLNFPYAHQMRSTSWLSDTAEIGDSFYLLRDEKGRILYIFNQRFWKLNKSEFSQQGNTFIPNQ